MHRQFTSEPGAAAKRHSEPPTYKSQYKHKHHCLHPSVKHSQHLDVVVPGKKRNPSERCWRLVHSIPSAAGPAQKS